MNVFDALTQNERRFQPLLSGPQIANARITASRATYPGNKRMRKILSKPAHLGKKQLMKAAAAL